MNTESLICNTKVGDYFQKKLAMEFYIYSLSKYNPIITSDDTFKIHNKTFKLVCHNNKYVFTNVKHIGKKNISYEYFYNLTSVVLNIIKNNTCIKHYILHTGGSDNILNLNYIERIYGIKNIMTYDLYILSLNLRTIHTTKHSIKHSYTYDNARFKKYLYKIFMISNMDLIYDIQNIINLIITDLYYKCYFDA
jgi:hypothetical protein